MQNLQSYNPFTSGFATKQDVINNEPPEILISSSTLASGVSSISLSSSAYTFSAYSRIHIRLTDVYYTSVGATSAWFISYQGLKNGALISGTHGYTTEAITSTTATGWNSANTTPPISINQTSGTGIGKASYNPQIDIYIDKNGIEVLEVVTNSLNSQPTYHKRGYMAFPSSMGGSDYCGIAITLTAGSGTGLAFSSGKINVYGVK